MKTVAIDRSTEWDVCEVHCFADIHLGDKLTDGELLKRRIKHCEETENCIALLNGDLCNNAVKLNSPSDVYSESIRPMEQMKRVVDLFGKLAEQDKIAAITDGNHERRTYKNDGIDLSEVIATQLGIRERYSPGAALVFLRFGRQTGKDGGIVNHGKPVSYTIFLNHGSGGGSKVGGKANRLVSMAEIIDADIFVHSHVHEPIIVKRGFYRTNYGNRSVQRVDRLFINTAAYLDYSRNGIGGYGEIAEYVPNSKDTPVVYLDGHTRRMWATL